MPNPDPPSAPPQKAGIVVDDWKLPVFRRRLKEAGFEFEEKGNLTKGSSVLTVQTNNLLRLKGVLEAAQRECRKSKR
jgi:hypothetical protein